ncbi:LINE-1 retrotransposable element ORF1 protein [Anabarilius grahami]|uniref:LINE-1 retrotransposable element ORF1 protein n=1 Tax=Anabarilius grahami TaxID=495550 RepID=A0A3N0Y9J5_ANAGA|nr:LINE-1 retrotransposable element ORF1 protein [Anabarilius grahami]
MPDLRKAAKANEPAESTSSGQSAILQAINSLRNELLAKMDEKAEMQNEEIRKQISGLRDELKGAIDQANIKANALEERTAGLETAANGAFKSCRKDRIYEQNRHERHHYVVNTSGKLVIFIKLRSVRVWGVSVRNMAKYHNTYRYLAVTLSGFSIYNEVADLKKEVVSLAAKVEDLEARSRRCNLRIFGVEEGREAGVSASTFVAKRLQKVMGLDEPHVIDRAHRTLQQAPGDGQPPRAFVVKCHYYQEKESILRKAVTSPKLVSENGDTIGVFPDYMQNVARRRAAFGQVRQLLRQCEGVKYGLLYPAKLRITTRDGQQKSFTDPEKAVTFVRGLMSD